MEDIHMGDQPRNMLSALEANKQLFKHLLSSLRKAKNFQSADNNSVFVVYAHDQDLGKSEAPPAHSHCVIQLIKWLNALGTRVLSDRHPVPRPGARSNGEASLYNIFENQLCLMPSRARYSGEPSVTVVDKVILCASPLLERYCESPGAEDYMRRLEMKYSENRHLPRHQLSSILRDFVDGNCHEPYFHHVLTEIAFLRLRKKHMFEGHGIIPVPLNVQTVRIPYVPEITRTDLQVICDPNAKDIHKSFFKLLKQVFPADRRILDIHLEAYLDFCTTEDLSEQAVFDVYYCASRFISNEMYPELDTGSREQEDRVARDQFDQEVSTRRAKFLAKLNELPYADRKNRNMRSQAGTCQWAVNQEPFVRWANREDVRLLFITANPGCGKSVLCRYLIDTELGKWTEGTVCYFFFKDDFVDQRSAIGALRCILHQLFVDQDHLLTTEILNKVDSNAINLESFTDLWNTLIYATLSPRARSVICVIDALDECDSKDKTELFNALAVIIPEARIKFLVTSRPYHEEMAGFNSLEEESTAFIHLSGDHGLPADRLGEEIDQVVLSKVSKLRGLTEQEQKTVYTELTKNPNRTYLWVTLVMDLIKNLKAITQNSLLEQIRTLPQTVDEAYEKLLNKIDKQDEARARKLLNVVLAAERPFTVEEMAWALQLEDEHWSQDPPQVPQTTTFRNDVRTICGLFLSVVDGRIYLLHQTAREFLLVQASSSGKSNTKDRGFDNASSCPQATKLTGVSKCSDVDVLWKWKSCFFLPSAHAVLARICMLRLSLRNRPDTLRVHNVHGKEQDGDTEASSVLLAYATIKWPIHCDAAKHELQPWMKEAYQTCVDAAKTRLLGADKFQLNTPLMVAVFINVRTIVDYILSGRNEDPVRLNECEAEKGFSALHIATLQASTDIIQSLIRAGASINLQGDHGTTALCLAICRVYKDESSEVATQIFLQHGANPNILWYGESALIWGLKVGLSSHMLRQLLQHGADPNLCCNQRNSALLIAIRHDVRKNKDEILFLRNLEILLEYGANPLLENQDGQSAFTLAAQEGLSSVIKLFDGYVYKSSMQRNSRGLTALHIGSGKMSNTDFLHTMVVELGADLEALDNENKTPLHHGAMSGRGDIVETLLILGANVNALTAAQETPLDLSIRRLYNTYAMAKYRAANLKVALKLWAFGGTTNRVPRCGKSAQEIAEQTSEGELYALLHHYENSPDFHKQWQRQDDKEILLIDWVL